MPPPPLPEFLSKIPDSAPVRVEAVLYVHAPLHNFITKAQCFHSNVLRFCTFHNTDYVLIKNASIQDELFPTYRCIRKGLIWILQNTIQKIKKIFLVAFPHWPPNSVTVSSRSSVKPGKTELCLLVQIYKLHFGLAFDKACYLAMYLHHVILGNTLAKVYRVYLYIHRLGL